MRRRTQQGFTLLEILIVVAIILIMAAVAAPYIIRSVRRLQATTSARSIATILQTARYEAIKRNQRVATLWVAGSATQGSTYGVDINGNGAIDTNEPYTVLSPRSDFFYSWSPGSYFPLVYPWSNGLPADYTVVGCPGGYSFFDGSFQSGSYFALTFSPQGTVVTNASGAWQLSPTIQGVQLMRGTWWDTDYEFYLITVTPSGTIKLWWLSNAEWTWRPL
jgi:prepilin-type N-terminal cleavage/methylation domain-containing protein